MKGAITALVTPFTAEGHVDYDGLRKLARWQVKQGINGILVLGTTGEAPTIEDHERTSIIKTVISEVKGKVPVIVGTGTYSTKHSVHYSKEAQSLGADAVLVVTPYYSKPTDEGIYQHFKAIAESIRIPVIVYNIVGRTGRNIDAPLMKRLSTIRNIEYVKEASGNMEQMMQILRQAPKLKVFSGDDCMTLPLMSLGGVGVISVVSNLVPGKVSKMCNYGLKGKMKKAQSLHYELLPLFKAAFIETNPIPIKAAMRMAGLPAGGYRLPMCEMQDENREKLKNVLKEMRIIR
jgi:4-hydroxy-tetrahydrodipicolinate synthase